MRARDDTRVDMRHFTARAVRRLFERHALMILPLRAL